MKQVAQQQACGACANNAHLRLEATHG
jgi:hypothetical protein